MERVWPMDRIGRICLDNGGRFIKAPGIGSKDGSRVDPACFFIGRAPRIFVYVRGF